MSYALAAMLCLLLVLTGCGSVSSRGKESLQLYQPPVLNLKAGEPIQTKEGRYVPQVDEVWHSDARFRQLERENIDLIRANTELRLREKSS